MHTRKAPVAALLVGTFLLLAGISDPCEFDGEISGEETFYLETISECCDEAPDEDDGGSWEPVMTVTISLFCIDEEADCGIESVSTSSGNDPPFLGSPTNPRKVVFRSIGDVGSIDVTTTGNDCDSCCIVVEQNAGCCWIPDELQEPKICQPLLCEWGWCDGYLGDVECPVDVEMVRGACEKVPDCDAVECEQLCKNGEDPDEGGGGDSGDPGDECPGTENTVDLHRGHKRERETDLRVSMPGRDFTITRAYSSDPEFSSNGLVGPNWTLSVFHVLDMDSTCQGTLRADAGTNYSLPDVANCDVGVEVPIPGPTDYYWMKSSLEHSGKDVPVWRFVEPGGRERVFIRANEGTEISDPDWHQVDGIDTPYPEGLLVQESDQYGNKALYTYMDFGDTVRLDYIQLSDADDSAVATIEFTWVEHWHEKIQGKVEQIVVKRNGDPTQQVKYTYMDEWDPEAYSSDLGTQGDLVQVLHSEEMNAGAARERVTQYRYHCDCLRESGNYDWQGGEHQLKMVIRPAQFEYVLDDLDDHTIENKAAHLLSVRDEAWTAHLSQYRPVDLAAKIIEAYEPWDPMSSTDQGRVVSQILNEDCGCAGGSTRGKHLEYERFEWGSGDTGATTKVIESKPDGAGNWTAHRTRYYDTELLGTAPGAGEPDLRVPYLINQAIKDDSDNYWVTHYKYDSDRNRTSEYTPASIDQYDPSAGDNDEPDVTLHDHQGLVYHYDYDSGNRRSEVAVSEGDLGTETVISRYYYGEDAGSGWNAGNTRPHLISKIERFPIDGSTTAFEDTKFFYTFHSGDAIASRETQQLSEDDDENGPSTSVWYSSFELYDSLGNNIWSRAADGSLTHRTYDASGFLESVERNAAPDFPQGHPLNPQWTGRHSDGGSLTTTYLRDEQGRLLQRTSPDGVTTYTQREMLQLPDAAGTSVVDERYAEITYPHELDPGTDYAGPATITWFNAANQPVAQCEYLVVNQYQFNNDDVITSNSLGTDPDPVAKQLIQRNQSGLVEEVEVWAWIDDVNERTHTTQYFYDALGRVDYVINPNETVTRNTYDIFDRVIEEEVGVADGTDPSEMVTRTEYFYDHELDGGAIVQGVGNGNLTVVRQHVDGSTQRETFYSYDYRDRRYLTENPAPPHQLVVYDNLGRVVEQGSFAAVPTDIDDASRGQYSTTSYSQRGLVWKQSVAIDPAPSSGAGFLETHTWYDEAGRAVGQWGPNSPMTKTTYDGLGRPVAVYTVPGSQELYADVYDTSNHEAIVTDNEVIEQVEYRYIEGGVQDVIGQGKLDLVTSRRRLHDETGDGALGSSNAITTYTATDYDAAGRAIRSLNYGTGDDDFESGGQAPSLDPGVSPPAPQEFDATDALVTETAYDERGHPSLMTEYLVSPASAQPDDIITTHYAYDALGRRIAVVENYDDSIEELELSWASPGVGEEVGHWNINDFDDVLADNTNRVTTYAYDGIGNLVKQTAHMPDDGVTVVDNQVTTYIYGVRPSSASPSELSSNDLLNRVEYPDGQAGPSIVTYAYNRLGEVTVMVDQNETEHEYTRDGLGRVTSDDITPDGGFLTPTLEHLDLTVRSIDSEYDDLGRLERVVSLGGSTGTEVINVVEFEFTPLGQVAKIHQEHDGDVTGSTAFVEYEYDNEDASTGNYSRRTKLHYPEGDTVEYEYDGSAMDDLISRVSRLNMPQAPKSPSVAYEYVGMHMPAIVDYEAIDVQLDRTVAGNGARASGTYHAFDRYGRVKRHMWVDGGFDEDTGGNPNVPPIVEITHTYDDASNRETRNNENPTLAWGHSHAEFTYDNLHRLISAEYADSTNSPERTDDWALDVLGNWDQSEPPVGDDSYPTDDRDHNGANELLSRDITGWDSDNNTGSGGSQGQPDPTFFMTYDANGNLLTQEIPTASDPGGDPGHTPVNYYYDAWNRLVAVKYSTPGQPGGKPRVEFEYNGLNWRTVKRSDTEASSPDLNQQRIMYYSADWQLLEEHIYEWGGGGLGGSPDFYIDRHMQYVWGLRYIDDIVLRQQDSNVNGTFDTGWYHCTDTLFSTVAVLNDAANLIERVSYDAYGMARHHHAADIDGDGAVTQDDYDLVTANLGNFGVGDIDRSGIADIKDQAMANDSKAALPRGEISKTDNIVGYAGYLFNAEIHGAGMYTVRHRHYAPDLGRWLTRDPAGYVDGMNLYEYASSFPVRAIDAFGLTVIDVVPATDDSKKKDNKKNNKLFDFDPIRWSRRYSNTVSGCDYLVSPMNVEDMRDQILEVLEECDDCISQLNIRAHGNRTSVNIGNNSGEGTQKITEQSIAPGEQMYNQEIEEIVRQLGGEMCEDAEIVLWSCHSGSGNLCQRIADLTDVDVWGIQCNTESNWWRPWSEKNWQKFSPDVVEPNEIENDDCNDCDE